MMHLPKLLVLLIIGSAILGKSSIAGQNTYEPYSFPSKIPAQYQIDVEARYQRLMGELKESFPEKDEGQISRYAEKQVYGLKHIIESGRIYLGWKELENYLDAIVKKLLPSDINEEAIEVYASTGTSVNAFAFHNGTILINIGLLAEAESEAEVAFILSHELSHYFYKDVRKQYFNSLESKKKKNRDDEEFILESAINQAAYSRSMERRADSFSFHLTQKAGYNIEPGIVSLYKMLSEEKQFDAMGGDGKTMKTVMVTEGKSGEKEEKTVDEYLFTSHPGLEKRTGMLRKMNQQNNKPKGSNNFLVSESKFHSLREKARYEKIHLLLKRNQIRTAIEKSFAYHLLDPDNPYFQTHLLKGLRRAMYLYPELREEGFLTHIYDQEPFTVDSIGILKDLHYILPDSISYGKIKARHFLDEDYEFNTYIQAFDYFSEKCLDQNLKEVYLTLALHYRKDTATKKELIKKYLSADGIQHRAFAKALMKENIDDALKGSRNLILLNQFKFIEDHTYGYHRRFIRESREKEEYISKAKDHIKANNPKKTLLSAKDLKSKDYSNFINTLTIFNTVKTFEERLKKKDEEEQPETFYMNEEAKNNVQDQKLSPRKIFYYKPGIWNHFKNHEINSLGYLSVIAFDDKTDIVGYLNLINPLYYLKFFQGIASGPERFHFSMFYYQFSPGQEDKIQNHEEDVGYKMTQNNFINALYYTLNNEKFQSR